MEMEYAVKNKMALDKFDMHECLMLLNIITFIICVDRLTKQTKNLYF